MYPVLVGVVKFPDCPYLQISTLLTFIYGIIWSHCYMNRKWTQQMKLGVKVARVWSQLLISI